LWCVLLVLAAVDVPAVARLPGRCAGIGVSRTPRAGSAGEDRSDRAGAAGARLEQEKKL